MHDQETLKFTGHELSQLSAYEIVGLLGKREISPSELLSISFDRIEQVEPKINATPTICKDRAEIASQNLNVENRDHPGWLGGLPLSIKDLTAVEGVRTTDGTVGKSNVVPEKNSPIVDQIEGYGGIVVGKTNTPEMGVGGNTFNEIFGPTLNPWDTRLNAGGSSGGAAASLATGEVWLSHGSDHGGSLRTPAAYCGIVGLRPSPGRAGGGPANAGFMLEPVNGPMARNVLDCALFLDTMSDLDTRHPISLPTPKASFQQSVLATEDCYRIAFSHDLGGFFPTEPEMDAHLAAVMGKLTAAGAVVDELSPNLDTLEKTYHTLRGLMMVADFRREPEAHTRHFKETLKENWKFGLNLTVEDIADAHLDRTILYNEMHSILEEFDVLACPVVGNMQKPQSEEWVKTVNGIQLNGYMDWLKPAFLATTTGLPAISVPVGLGANNLPVGLQLIGPPRGEALLLQVARFVELVVGENNTPIDPISK